MKFLNGWKSIISWGLIQVPGLSTIPGLAGSIEAVIQNPTKEAIVNAILQALLAAALGHRAVKNVVQK